MKKIIQAILCIVCILAQTMVANASVTYNDTYIEKNISLPDYLIYDDDGCCWMALRILLESIGATITWNESKREIGINYDNECYIGMLEPYHDMDLNYQFITIINSKYYGSLLDGLSLQLNPWQSSGSYEIFDGWTYIDDYAMVRLLYYMGYYLDTDNNKLIPVSENGEYDYKYKDYLDYPVSEEAETLASLLLDAEETCFIINNFFVKKQSEDMLHIDIDFTFKSDEYREWYFRNHEVEELNMEEQGDSQPIQEKTRYKILVAYEEPFDLLLIEGGEDYKILCDMPKAVILKWN